MMLLKPVTSGSVSNKGGPEMKTLLSTVFVAALAVGFVAPAFAAEKAPKTQAACEKAKMKWDATTKTCSNGM